MKTPKYDYISFIAEEKSVMRGMQRTKWGKRIEFDLTEFIFWGN